MFARAFSIFATLAIATQTCNVAIGFQYKPQAPSRLPTATSTQLDVVDKFTRSGIVQIAKEGDRINLLFQPSRDNLDLSLGPIRTLSYPCIQEDIELDMALQAKLETLVEELVKIDSRFRFEKFADCFDLQTIAEQRIGEFSDELDEFLKDLGGSNEMNRLQQIERRFLAWGSRGLDSKSIRWFKDKIALSSVQRNAINEILENTNAPVTDEDLIEGLSTILNTKQIDSIQNLVDGGVLLAPPRGLEGTHFRPFYRHEEKNDRKRSDQTKISNIQVYGVSLLPNGQLTDTQYHEYRESNFYGRSAWQQIHKSIVDGKLEWLEIMEEQKVALEELQQTDRRENGMTMISYVGQAELMEVIRNRPDPSVDVSEYKAWEKQYSDAKTSADKTLYLEIEKILLPHQFDAMEMSLGLSRLHQTGILNALVQETLGDTFALSKSQKEAINELMVQFLEKSNEYYTQLDSSVAKAIGDEQSEHVQELFGSRPEFYPSLWLVFPL